ncbi:hypothetical protein EUBSIR_00883 [[Eubacterium] siraeum DSM 15702]|uniref:Uncharacterized protein n=1 Tax=[Eubacterium] siraeum DSM 15702 TaxID=428128 RepID=B0MM34_9FIRM|nr:hypothetical protein EUBSIR_00883 [[Eubacterium] siraeum DSM 15702]
MLNRKPFRRLKNGVSLIIMRCLENRSWLPANISRSPCYLCYILYISEKTQIILTSRIFPLQTP